MFYTPVEEVPYQVGDVLSFSDESNCFINCFKISSIVNNVIYVESIGEVPPLEDIRNKITEDYEHLYVCDFAVWCLNKPMIGSVNIGIGATALGVKTTARGTAAEASGYLTNAIAPFSSASGLRTTASGERSHTEGSDTIASASCAHAEGYQSQALASYGHAEGAKTIASGDAAHAEGYQTSAEGRGSHAEGRVTYAVGSESHAEGWHTIAFGDCQHVEGQYNIEDNGNNTKTQFKQGKYIHIAGNGVKDKPSNAHTLDWDGNAWFAGDVTVGKNGYKLINERESIGKATLTHPGGVWMQGEIFNDYENNKASLYAHAEGSFTEANDQFAHAEGYSSKATSTAAHAEGRQCEANGMNSHAEGYLSKTFAAYAHAEGGSCEARGEGSHAEGYASKATGQNAHAEGRATQANGAKSHSEGWNTIASEECQHVQGKYNIVDENNSAGNYAHVVGNGTAATKRSNAHTLDWQGNAWFAGDVTVGKNKEKLITKSEMMAYIEQEILGGAW